MNLYETAYSNEVHQLLISASRHLYVLSDGRIKYQKKVIEGTWQKPKDSSKDQVVHYIMRDHYSHAMYAEIHIRSENISPQQFLWNAWSKKGHYPFYGTPEFLILPKSIYSNMLFDFVSSLGIRIIKPTSGFMAGVRTLREWDRTLNFVFNHPFETLVSFHQLQSKMPEILQAYYDQNKDGTSKLDTWKSHTHNLFPPPAQEEFFRLFRKMQTPSREQQEHLLCETIKRCRKSIAS